MAFYRALLRLYPSGFRAEYGEELGAMHAQRMRETSGATARLLLLLSAIADVVPNALAVHFDILKQDVRYATRALLRAPGFAITAILVVALGVGANTAAFSLADFVLLRPLPFPQADRLVKLWQTSDGYSQTEPSPANYRDWKMMAAASPTSNFAAMAAYTGRAVNLVGDGLPQRLQTSRVTPDLMSLIGVPAMFGRVITPADATNGSTAVISYQLWRTQFGGDPAVLGRTIRLDGTPHTIIGVMPASFRFPNRKIDLWSPLLLTGDDFTDRGDNYLEVIARLKPNATPQRADAEIVSIAARLEKQYPEENRGVGAQLVRLRDQMSSRSRMLVLALCGASLCILLLACANLASLLLARGVSRTRELAVRAALGAGRDRLVRQLITESIALAILGGVVGVAIAMAGLPLLAQLVPTALPIGEVPSVDLRVLAFAAVLIAITGLGFGVAPALRAGKSGALEALREGARTGGGRRQRMRSILVILEVTGSIVLLISSGLLMRAVWRIQAIDPGFRAEGVTALRTALPMPKYSATGDRQRFFDRVLEEVRTLPGVKSAAYATGLPIDRTGGIWPVAVDGANVLRTNANSATLRYVTPGFFSTMGIPLLRGRDISKSDTADHPFVAVVSESFVRRQWPNEDPIGRRFGFALSERTVVGVVGDVRGRGLERQSEPQVYIPSGQVQDGSLIGYVPQDLVIRSKVPAERWMPAVRRIIAEADPEQPISDVRPVSEILASDTAPRRVQVRLLAILSAVALLIAGIGLHGLLSFAVSQRTQELGIRRALGAQAGAIIGMVLREGLRLAVIGAVVGVVIALIAGRGMSALLFGVRPGDPQTILAAVALCLLTAVVGCLRPALRAARIDPMTALREG
jgi:putative ABC transport system permease protein